MKNQYLLAALALGMMMLHGGCASTKVYRAYEGPARDPDVVAGLVASYKIDLLRVDGERKHFFFIDTLEYRVELLPGAHELELRYYDPGDIDSPSRDPLYRSDPVQLAFEAQAGHTYRVNYELPREAGGMARKFQVWIDDVTGPKPVSVSSIPQAHPAPTEPAAPDAVAPQNLPPASTLEQLKKAWPQASDAERQEFMKYIRDLDEN
jgi:hypothetical protein